MKILAFASIALFVSSAACTERAQFQPTEPVQTLSPTGQRAVAYNIRTDPQSNPIVHVRVWSEGAKRANNQTEVDVALELQNTGDQLVAFDLETVTLDAFNSMGGKLPQPLLVRAQSEQRDFLVPPQTASMLKLRFMLPVPIALAEVRLLRLRWALATATGGHYVQFTEFRQQRGSGGTTVIAVIPPSPHGP
jgi:hypothetical protein